MAAHFNAGSVPGEVAAAFFLGTRQYVAMLVVEPDPGAEAITAGHQLIARTGAETVVFQGQSAIAGQRAAARADVGAVDLEAVTHFQRAAARRNLEIAVIVQCLAVDGNGLQVGLAVGV